MDTNMIRICHGSENIIEKPEFGKGKTTNDYGRGFYCTESIELAKEWACDIIIGYRADDSYFTFAKNFVVNGITLGQLQEAMKLGRLGEQIVLKSRRAFERLRFVEYESAPSEIYFKKKLERDQSARAEYRKRVRHMPNKDELLMIDIMREEMENGDPRLL